MDCKQAKILLAPHILGDLNNEPQRCKELQAHLICCPNCAEMYEGFKETIGFVLDHKAEFAQAFAKARAMKKNSEEVLMNCEQAQFLMTLFVANDPDLTDQQHIDFQKHIESCSECAREYEESQFDIELAKQYRPISDEKVALIKRNSQSYKPKMTIEEGWKNLCRHCPDLAESAEKPKSLQLFLRMGAVAACLVIGLLIWVVFLNYSKPQTLPQKSSFQQVASAPEPSMKVELVTSNGNIPISSGQQITSAGQLKTLLFNSKHQMILNTNTVLAFEPLVENGNIGCQVKLLSGQIYTHVEHDGTLFIVDTSYGKAVIMGTIFDIKATDTGTTLVVSEGTVQFESENYVVNVAAGQTSEIIGQSAPSRPISCDIAELTAWATGYKRSPAVAQAESNDDDCYLALSLRKLPIVLEETDYNQWQEQKRGWFKQNFPWIFQLKDALAKEGIKVDYPMLLIESGDVWQFVYLDVSPARFSVIDPNSLINTASDYGFGKQWLLENVSTTKSALENSVLSDNSFTGLKAFERWLKYAGGNKEPLTSTYSYHACRYLAETKSLIWFAVRDGKYDLADKERTEVLALLQKEVTASCECQNEVLHPQYIPRSSCDENKCQGLINDEIGLVSTIYEHEKALVKHVSAMSLTSK